MQIGISPKINPVERSKNKCLTGFYVEKYRRKRSRKIKN